LVLQFEVKVGTNFSVTVLASIGSILVLNVDASALCLSSEIAITRTNLTKIVAADGKDYVEIDGAFVNNCTEPTGVELQFVFSNSEGQTVSIVEFWPARQKNIEPKATYVFSKLTPIPDEYSAVSGQVLDTKRWESVPPAGIERKAQHGRRGRH
jgi:hypothetical protein